MTSGVLITKADGEQELFDSSKLDASLKRAGADADVRARVIGQIEQELAPGMRTADIYTHAFDILQKEKGNSVAARYSLKRAVFDLGPSGFPFEQFVAEILKAHGWRTQTGVDITGRCVLHEVDVLAKKDGKTVGIEAKFHNRPGVKSDVKDALYVHARYQDLTNARKEEDRIDEGWLVTNTRFTHNAVRYGRCVGLSMFGWDYPKGKGIEDLIATAQVHPLTCLTTLTAGEKKRLLDKNIVLCRNLIAGKHMLSEYGIADKRVSDIVEEAHQLCQPVKAH